MTILQTRLLFAHQQNKLLEVIDELYYQEDELEEELIYLHNHKSIDIISTFKQLKNSGSLDFFSTRRILEKILPELEADILEVMKCVVHLYREAGQDFVAHTILESFVKFCAIENTRPKIAIEYIQKQPNDFIELLVCVITAGAKLDMEYYLTQAIQFTKHPNSNFRNGAIHSLRTIHYSGKSEFVEQALACLETCIIQDIDEQDTWNIIRSAFDLYRENNLLAERVTKVIDIALSKGNDFALRAAAELLYFYAEETPAIVLDKLFLYLCRVKFSNKTTIENIDYGISKLLPSGHIQKAIDFLEQLLLANQEYLSENIFRDVFDSTSRSFIENNLLSRLATRWFLRGDRVLCEAVSSMCGLAASAYERDFQLTIDMSEFDTSDPIFAIFIARKAIGYLFSHPIMMTSLLVSLLQHTHDDNVANELSLLSSLLFRFVLINYPEIAGNYLKQLQLSDSKTKNLVESILKTLEDYQTDLKSVGNIPELYPSQTQLETYHRCFNQQVETSMKKAEKKSVLRDLVKKQVILCGRKTSHYAPEAGLNHFQRMEVPLAEHSMTMPYPYLLSVSPFELEYNLRIFQVERLVKN